MLIKRPDSHVIELLQVTRPDIDRPPQNVDKVLEGICGRTFEWVRLFSWKASIGFHRNDVALPITQVMQMQQADG